jgi:GNAT superfamily N-acetyltransferase
MHDLARRANLLISTDPVLVDLSVVHGYLVRSYWASGIPLDVVKTSIEHSLVFGVYDTSTSPCQQLGFARVVTDRATFAYLADVFILELHRAQGLSKWLMQVILDHPDLQTLRRWMLLTRDAHGVYRQFGFIPAAAPDRVMERHFPDAYKQRKG